MAGAFPTDSFWFLHDNDKDAEAEQDDGPDTHDDFGRRRGESAAGVAELLKRAGVSTPILILSHLHDPKEDAPAGTDRHVRVLRKPVLPSRIAAAAELVGPRTPSCD